jgi:hypothetical protein
MNKKLVIPVRIPKETTSLRLSNEDRQIIEKLKTIWADPLRGSPSQTEVIQMALRKAVLLVSV